MEIDLEKAQIEYIEYIKKFNIPKDQFLLKKDHSLRVMNNSKQITTKLNLSQEEIDLAQLIGMLHDIARFQEYINRQLKQNEGFEHGDYAVGILNKDIEKYIGTRKYDEIIKKAIKNHSKYKIEEELKREEELFAKIIRDADKLDKFYEVIEIYSEKTKEKVKQSIISEDILNQFKNHMQIKREKNVRYEQLDKIIMIISFIFDINFKETFGIIKKEEYINKIIDCFEYKDLNTKQEIENIRKIANEYVEDTITAIATY